LRKNTRCHSYPLSAKLLDALVTSYWIGEDFKRPQMLITIGREVRLERILNIEERFEKMACRWSWPTRGVWCLTESI